MSVSRHLDIGCGIEPRNPFLAQTLYGVDIRYLNTNGVEIRKANLAQEPIPFESNFFDSVSAFDFIEHIPRVDNLGEFPFVRLMNEIYRVLKPEGVFYAVTPCYPNKAVFVDPTHVNFITEGTHKYFTLRQGINEIEIKPDASIYGFTGQFREVACRWCDFSARPLAIDEGLIHRFMYAIKRKRQKYSHYQWLLRAQK